jgi:hypothetical protein
MDRGAILLYAYLFAVVGLSSDHKSTFSSLVSQEFDEISAVVWGKIELVSRTGGGHANILAPGHQ